MKALVLAGGAGTRLRPITHTRAKQLVPVANKPILFYALESIAGAGIKEVGVIVGETASEVRAAVGDGSAWGLTVTYLPQAAPLGLAHCMLIAREYLGDDDVIMYLGDNLLQQDLAKFVGRFEGDQERDSLGGVVRLVEKPVHPPSDLALVGVYLFDARIHDAVAAISPSARGELEITDAIQWLIDRGEPVSSEILQGWWIDTGKLTPLLEANRLLLETFERRIDGEVDDASHLDGRVVVEAGASVVRSHIRGPVVVGSGTVIVDSFVGPSSAIGRDCRVERSEIEHSVILDHCSIIGVGRLEDSLLGYHVEVVRSDRRPRATRLMVGDHSQVDLG
jgi:glucose-1-phosphate thymidylyltransferase